MRTGRARTASHRGFTVADSIAAMGAIAPTAKTVVWGQCPQVVPTGILLINFRETVK